MLSVEYFLSLIPPPLHALGTKRLTTPAMRLPVDRHAAFHADAHAARRAAGLVRHRPAKRSDARQCNRGGDDGAARDADRFSVHAKLNRISHEPPLRWQIASVSTAPREFPVRVPTANRRGAAPCRATS